VTRGQLGVSWLGRHAVVTMPAELDSANSADVSDLLSAVAAEDPEVITGDLTSTTFCDSAGMHAIARASEHAALGGAELRLAVGDSPVARILQLTGLDQVMPLYHDVQQSLDTPRAGSGPGGQVAQPVAGAERPAETIRDMAGELRKALLPTALPVLPQARIAACYLRTSPGPATGGDWFGAVPLGGSSVALIAGEVAGHGVAAAAAMGQLRAVLTELLAAESDLATVLARTDAFAGRTDALRAATLAVAVLDPGDGTLRYATCGSPPPLIVSASGAGRFAPSTGTGPLGTGSAPVLATTVVQPGEVVMLYSDELIERPNRTLEEGMAELAKVAAGAAAGRTLPAATASTAADRVCQLSVELLAPTGYAGDVAALAAQRLPVAAPELHLELPAAAGTVRGMRRSFSHWLSQLDPLVQDQDALLLAAAEIITNAAEHAYPPGQPGPVEFHAMLDGDGQLECRILDHGTWRTPDLASPWRGQGLMVAAQLVDQMRIQHLPRSAASVRGARGTLVTLRHQLRRPAIVAAGATAEASAPFAGPPFSVEASADGPGARATVQGPVDSATAYRLAGYLLAACRGGTVPLTVDLSAVTHLGRAGVRALYQVKEQLNAYQRELALVAAPGSSADVVLTLAQLPHTSGITGPSAQPEHK
jgi:anti-anti-sigma factor